MPGVGFVPLARFDRHDTEQMVSSLLGERRRSLLAEQAFERSNGNPYLVELLVKDLEPAADRLPDTLPGDLRQALLAAWHRLNAPTRELMQVLAVGGRPVNVDVLRQVAEAVGVDADKVAAGVGEAGDAGLVVVGGDGSVWFHHPLVAEVLVATLLPSEAVRLHAEYVTVWLAARGAPPRLRAAHLALHYQAAGDASAALVWSLRAAAEAERVHGYSEESHHLTRACRLWPVADDAARVEAGEHLELLLRGTRAANRAGDFATALSLGERAFELTGEDVDPLARCRVLNELNQLRTMQRMDWSLTPPREAVRLSSGYPGSPEHVYALAMLSCVEYWHGLLDAVRHADDALAAARACGSDEALAFSLAAAANLKAGDPDGLVLAEEALALARRSGNAGLIADAARAWGNCAQRLGRAAEVGPFAVGIYEELVRLGAPHQAGVIAVYAALQLFESGEWQLCRALLRDAMALRMAAFWARAARLAAAELAACCGQPSAAQQHLERANELGTMDGGGLDRPHVWTASAVLAAQRKYGEAIATIASELEVMVRVDHQLADLLMTRAAEYSADLAEHARDQRIEAITTLDALEAVRTSAGAPAMFEPQAPRDPIPPARRALYIAHRSRVAGERGGEIDAWEQAIDACDAAGLLWEAAQSRYRLAVALLAQRRNRGVAAAALREARRVAADLGAEPLRADVEALAGQAHISLAEPGADERSREGVPLLNGLTKREHDVLGHLMAGRTYAEIATELFISEKTVSAHVSNLLRKTGTSSRIELAALARRHTPDAS